jgi:hypothetical protein
VLRDVEKRDLSIELFGRRLESPLLLSPIGVLDLAHFDADLAVARAAAGLRVPFMFSNQASVAMERCALEMDDAPRWFQLYWSRSDDLVASLVRRAQSRGFTAIVLTLDTTMLGWRPRDLELGSLPFLSGTGLAQYTTDPVFRAELKLEAAQQPVAATAADPGGDAPPITVRSVAAALEQTMPARPLTTARRFAWDGHTCTAWPLPGKRASGKSLAISSRSSISRSGSLDTRPCARSTTQHWFRAGGSMPGVEERLLLTISNAAAIVTCDSQDRILRGADILIEGQA